MNKEFVKKMIQAKQLEYEAIKEILPDHLRKKVDSMENGAIELIKDVAFDFLKDCDCSKGDFNSYSADKNNDKTTGNFSNADQCNDKRKSSKKINVDFM